MKKALPSDSCHITVSNGLFVFVGPVASGKTTVRAMLKAHLQAHGARVISVSHKTSLPRLALAIERLSKRSWRDVYSKAFGILLMTDLALWIPVAAILRLLSKFYIVLVEDYLVGALNDYIYISTIYLSKPFPGKIIRPFVILLFGFAPDCIVYLDVAAKESKLRQISRRDLRLEHDRYLRHQRTMTSYILSFLRNQLKAELVVIDTTQMETVAAVAEVSRRCFESPAKSL